MIPGRNRIETRALNSVASAVTADELGVSAHQVRVQVTDSEGSLAFTVNSPVAMPTPTGTETEQLTERLRAATSTAKSRISELTGLRVRRVNIRATSAIITERRVQ